MPDLRFRILRDGSQIGTHTVTFRQSGDRLVASTNVDLKVRIAFITAFVFQHQCEEEWDGALLASLKSKTNDNGKNYSVVGAPTDDGFRTVGPGGPFTAQRDILTSDTIWNPQFTTQRQLINAQEGGAMGVTCHKLDNEALPGAPNATKYRFITPHYAGYVWYGSEGRWMRGIFESKGETLVYEAA